jgi:hypothetical protein
VPIEPYLMHAGKPWRKQQKPKEETRGNALEAQKERENIWKLLKENKENTQKEDFYTSLLHAVLKIPWGTSEDYWKKIVTLIFFV